LELRFDRPAGKIYLFDNQGRLLWIQEVQASGMPISFAHLAPGMYVLEWIDDRGTRRERVLKL
ncbi:MAG: T9SS type A sorting domain-containing protein, partial [Phaeodactylibacter sp.]|nr:T9SS type A sorting domain-containing protein [Phaeodactylibacter sp.]